MTRCAHLWSEVEVQENGTGKEARALSVDTTQLCWSSVHVYKWLLAGDRTTWTAWSEVACGIHADLVPLWTVLCGIFITTCMASGR